jgi:CRISPR-associated protein Cmr6
MDANLGWLYYVDYFRGIDYEELGADRNQKTIQAKVTELLRASSDKSIEEYPYLGNVHFKATTRYPGLIMGTGYPHELPDLKGQAILGFFFDYTTGLPVLPGSSIKGVLRSAFAYPEFVASLLEELTADEWSPEEIRLLERDIFGNATDESEIVPGRDIFYDAVIVSAMDRILTDDYLAPHGDGVTDEPIPLRFIKVAPGVTFRFDFELHDTNIGDKCLCVSQKQKLFIALLKQLGVGAKTNVGYGYLDNFQKVMTDEEKKAKTAKELKAKIQNALEGEDVEILKHLLSRHGDHVLAPLMEKRIEELLNRQKFAEMKRAWDRLDRTNRKHLESFIEKYEKDPDFAKYVQEARNILNQKKNQISTVPFEKVFELTKLKDVERFVKKFIASNPLSEEQKNQLENHIKSSVTGLPGRRNKFPFGTFGDERCFGKERANKLADDLGL